MKDKKTLFLTLSILGIIGLIVVFVANSSYAYEYKFENYTLFYSDNIEELNDNIQTYIDKIDDYLIPNTSYTYSDILTENYDFLVNFALDYIINNKEIYSDKITNLDNYTYYNNYMETKETNEYVDTKLLYEITDNFFGIKDFVIINDNVKIIDDYISLARYNEMVFEQKIVSVRAETNNDMVHALVNYENGDTLKYTFKKENNVLKLYNIEV